jgi:hypothetical protein
MQRSFVAQKSSKRSIPPAHGVYPRALRPVPSSPPFPICHRHHSSLDPPPLGQIGAFHLLLDGNRVLVAPTCHLLLVASRLVIQTHRPLAPIPSRCLLLLLLHRRRHRHRRVNLPFIITLCLPRNRQRQRRILSDPTLPTTICRTRLRPVRSWDRYARSICTLPTPLVPLRPSSCRPASCPRRWTTTRCLSRTTRGGRVCV